MRSTELARLAGVSVRTLRHHHAVGVLPEPPRDPNGYRRYGVEHLVRTLRVTRLAELGVPLERMPALLDDAAPGATDAALAALDDELAAKVAQLERQRALVAELRTLGTAPDQPPALARWVALLPVVSPEQAAADRDVLVLLARMVGEEGQAEVARLYERMAAPALRDVVLDLTRRFDALDDGSTDGEVRALADDLAHHLAPLLAELVTGVPETTEAPWAEVLDALQRHHLRPRQQEALALTARRLEEAAATDDG
ncbi:MerR family transcriptional regulator [Pseudokineococcus lusitanus]|uniref:DNA-binding transcriptional MerR regulator n=1 Tax=Pseudokineococcus lusitanus TaxID=763993 RepID=A0A3N1HKM6_9ACTN|nr:MerR family transcriptional regulator [Pseudokineococcus lusitanus]ROP43015.1 DNA-binding transcriptional MerR regulator [Pseudokineococcus lusitanus]